MSGRRFSLRHAQIEDALLVLMLMTMIIVIVIVIVIVMIRIGRHSCG
ncbi:hypothetical protein HEQ72_05405 [Haematospirillum sp. 15-248]|nr:hypothetical protein [Haematospirillum sp. 15-248]NKD87740.1 hypothetical protein [Haematospirillum sp. 15-248]